MRLTNFCHALFVGTSIFELFDNFKRLGCCLKYVEVFYVRLLLENLVV